MTFFNTTHATNPELAQYRQQALSQDEVILALFKENQFRTWTPSEVMAAVLPDAPVTSIRRAITTLTQDTHLVKTDTQRNGPYGRPEYAWRVADSVDPDQRQLF